MLPAVVYVLLFIAPQPLLYLYLRERLPDPRRPRRARAVRLALAVAFSAANHLPWLLVAARVFGGSVWGVGRIPYLAPFIAWQLLAWVLCALIRRTWCCALAASALPRLRPLVYFSRRPSLPPTAWRYNRDAHVGVRCGPAGLRLRL